MTEFEKIKFFKIASILILYYQVLRTVETRICKFTKFDCETYDKPFADFKECNMKVTGREKIAINMHVRLHRVPVNNVSLNAAFYLKSSNQRYQPFMYNSTTDFCKFLKRPNTLPFWKIVYFIIKPNSNINHTCPFNHDIIVENFILNPNSFNLVPFPTGDYLVVLRVGAYNFYRAEVRAFFLIKE